LLVDSQSVAAGLAGQESPKLTSASGVANRSSSVSFGASNPLAPWMAARTKFHCASCSVNSQPVWNWTPLRSCKVHEAAAQIACRRQRQSGSVQLRLPCRLLLVDHLRTAAKKSCQPVNRRCAVRRLALWCEIGRACLWFERLLHSSQDFVHFHVVGGHALAGGFGQIPAALCRVLYGLAFRAVYVGSAPHSSLTAAAFPIAPNRVCTKSHCRSPNSADASSPYPAKPVVNYPC
jgi:hypothetical protein